jgi:cell division protein FtsB
MSAAIKTNRTRKLPGSAPALWVVLGLAVAFFLIRYGQEVLMEHDINGKIAAQMQINAQMDEENKRLQAALEYYRSDKYIEQRAREDLNLRRADEEVLIPIGDAAGQASGDDSSPSAHRPATDGSGSGGEAGAPEARANWQRWFDLFTPFGGSP